MSDEAPLNTHRLTYVCLERVAEELMGRRKWKLYQEGMLPREDAPPADAPDPPALKIKTIEQINARDHDRDRDRARGPGQEQERSRPETILESLIKRPPAPPKLDTEEPADWKPPEKCYFCVDGEKGETVAGPTVTCPYSSWIHGSTSMDMK
ncbi:hypothetical protein EVAR_101951_1 [Eumeta japonica]|uniref:Uncharacterized protein n=1 Tax=Eumeta variegata TaxID=151549 RepID=A0A4C1TSK5_EUMVA|nr:hypothetical protein EVAR_101951_1 [Eumeta japonica]